MTSILNRRSVLAGAAAILAAPSTIVFAGTQTGTELILLLDYSSSMYEGSTLIGGQVHFHHDIQRYGHAEALMTPDIADLLVRKKVFVRVVVWVQSISVAREVFPGVRITTLADVQRLASLIRSKVPQTYPPVMDGTSHATGIHFALNLPRVYDRRIIDLSTDENAYEGIYGAVSSVRGLAIRQNATINIIVIGASGDGLLQYMTPGGFLRRVDSWNTYPRAIHAKIYDELVS